ncbi:hypothetical protein LguiB_030002 [Lonicera macranthoides]
MLENNKGKSIPWVLRGKTLPPTFFSVMCFRNLCFPNKGNERFHFLSAQIRKSNEDLVSIDILFIFRRLVV